MKSLVGIMFYFLGLVWGHQQEQEGKVVMCYFGSWSVYRYGEGKFDVEDIPPSLCSHLVYGFAGLDASDHTLRALDPYNDLSENWGRGAYQRFTGLKTANPTLKTLLAVGGWNEGATVFSDMAVSKETRAVFITSCLKMLLEHGFDGLDLDWEYPGGRSGSQGRPEDRANFALLVSELHAAFSPHSLLLTAAVGAGEATVDAAYDVASLAAHLDFINVMTYDYHGWWPGHAFTGHHAPLYSSTQDPEHPGYHRSLNFSIQHFLQLGARPGQLLLGIGAYGRGFELSSSSSSGQFAPSAGGIAAAPYTGTPGYWGYNEICDAVLAQDVSPPWRTVREAETVAPYAVRVNQWIGYDDQTSVKQKVEWAKSLGLGGAMFWSIDTEDWRGRCGPPFTLIAAAKSQLWGETTSTTTAGTTSSISNTSTLTPDSTPSTSGSWITLSSTPYPTSGTNLAETTHASTNPNENTTVSSNQTTPDSTTLQDTTPDSSTYPETTVDANTPLPLCSGPGLLPSPSSCSSYYTCLPSPSGGWLPSPSSCPPELVFDPSLAACNWPHLVPGCEQEEGSTALSSSSPTLSSPISSSPTTTSPPPSSPCSSSSGLLPVQGTCTDYWVCLNRSLMARRQCPPPLHFSPELSACDWPHNVDC